MAEEINVAVYGTLRRGQCFNKRYLGGQKYLGTIVIKGFSMLDLGAFPAIFEDVNNEKGVTVELYKVTEEVFCDLDRIEGYPHLYDRKQVRTRIGDFWVYFMRNRDKRLFTIESGDWVKFIKQVNTQNEKLQN